MSAPLKVMLVAAEASGDNLGAGLAHALKRRLGDGVVFCGVGGAKMAAHGVESPFDIAELSIFGWIEGIKAYGHVKQRVREVAALAAREKPDVAVLIDSWGFTIRVAKALRQADAALPLIKYVGPQVWASRPGRAKTLAGAVDLLLAINKMDVPWFENAGLKTVFVGNPALGIDFSPADGARFRAAIDAGPDDSVLLLFPGSRPGEVDLLAPYFENAVALVREGRPKLKIAVVVADTVREAVLGRTSGWPFRTYPIEGEAAKRDAMRGATVSLACSGTVSTELALAGSPMVIAYRFGGLTYWLAKKVVTVRFGTLFNIAADEEIAPEFIQNDCTGPNLAKAVSERLDDPQLRADQVARQYAALQMMGRGAGDPSELAADALLAFLEARAEAPSA
ncbi:MAG TPA: lipid-A-disaccharide synthase [Caulobacteraceae bacterium]|jgi:lipid-A-disaccharide synthase|nr:lipid-A-disaccharide synthase [Caulobacteraceae bacterium]